MAVSSTKGSSTSTTQTTSSQSSKPTQQTPPSQPKSYVIDTKGTLRDTSGKLASFEGPNQQQEAQRAVASAKIATPTPSTQRSGGTAAARSAQERARSSLSAESVSIAPTTQSLAKPIDPISGMTSSSSGVITNQQNIQGPQQQVAAANQESQLSFLRLQQLQPSVSSGTVVPSSSIPTPESIGTFQGYDKESLTSYLSGLSKVGGSIITSQKETVTNPRVTGTGKVTSTVSFEQTRPYAFDPNKKAEQILGLPPKEQKIAVDEFTANIETAAQRYNVPGYEKPGIGSRLTVNEAFVPAASSMNPFESKTAGEFVSKTGQSVGSELIRKSVEFAASPIVLGEAAYKFGERMAFSPQRRATELEFARLQQAEQANVLQEKGQKLGQATVGRYVGALSENPVSTLTGTAVDVGFGILGTEDVAQAGRQLLTPRQVGVPKTTVISDISQARGGSTSINTARTSTLSSGEKLTELTLSPKGINEGISVTTQTFAPDIGLPQTVVKSTGFTARTADVPLTGSYVGDFPTEGLKLTGVGTVKTKVTPTELFVTSPRSAGVTLDELQSVSPSSPQRAALAEKELFLRETRIDPRTLPYSQADYVPVQTVVTPGQFATGRSTVVPEITLLKSADNENIVSGFGQLTTVRRNPFTGEPIVSRSPLSLQTEVRPPSPELLEAQGGPIILQSDVGTIFQKNPRAPENILTESFIGRDRYIAKATVEQEALLQSPTRESRITEVRTTRSLRDTTPSAVETRRERLLESTPVNRKVEDTDFFADKAVSIVQPTADDTSAVVVVKKSVRMKDLTPQQKKPVERVETPVTDGQVVILERPQAKPESVLRAEKVTSETRADIGPELRRASTERLAERTEQLQRGKSKSSTRSAAATRATQEQLSRQRADTLSVSRVVQELKPIQDTRVSSKVEVAQETLPSRYVFSGRSPTSDFTYTPTPPTPTYPSPIAPFVGAGAFGGGGSFNFGRSPEGFGRGNREFTITNKIRDVTQSILRPKQIFKPLRRR